MGKLLQLAFLAAFLIPACAKTTPEVPVIRQPRTTFTVGPGTVISVHLLDMPFIAPHYYVVKYRTDHGELIEVWHRGKDIPVLQGMHGIMTYSTHPEMVRSFRVVAQTSPRWQSADAGR